MFCPNCGQENIAGARTCETCGADLTSVTVEQPDSQPVVPADYAASPDVKHAGFWLRFVAWIIDSVLLNIVSWIIMFSTGFVLADISLTGSVVWTIAFLALNIGLPWLYLSLMESSSKQATLGKMVLGIIVTDEAGNRISFGRATGRYFGKILSGLILFIGYIMIAFTRKKQGLHDIIASTLVIKK